MLGLLALSLPPRMALIAQQVLIGLLTLACAVAFDLLPGRDVLFLEVLP